MGKMQISAATRAGASHRALRAVRLPLTVRGGAFCVSACFPASMQITPEAK